MSRHTEQQKKKFWKKWKSTLLNRTVYTVLGWFFYPFILRDKVRKKMKLGVNSWWTTRLWYMINDDEVDKGYLGIDYNVKIVEDRGIPKWFASYYFNALRNPAYNYILTHRPKAANGSYANQELSIDNITQNGKRVHPLERADWVLKEDGSIDFKLSKIGEGEVWFNPDGDTSVSSCRHSKTYIKKFLFWKIYVTDQRGEWGNKYDWILRSHIRKK
jgi:hypothetical protein